MLSAVCTLGVSGASNVKKCECYLNVNYVRIVGVVLIKSSDLGNILTSAAPGKLEP